MENKQKEFIDISRLRLEKGYCTLDELLEEYTEDSKKKNLIKLSDYMVGVLEDDEKMGKGLEYDRKERDARLTHFLQTSKTGDKWEGKLDHSDWEWLKRRGHLGKYYEYEELEDVLEYLKGKYRDNGKEYLYEYIVKIVRLVKGLTIEQIYKISDIFIEDTQGIKKDSKYSLIKKVIKGDIR